MHVRCPHCRHPIELVEETAPEEVTCTHCGSHISLAAIDETLSFRRDKSAREADERNQIGRFELMRKVGVGAFGAVWQARDPELERVVAVKIPRRSGMSTDDVDVFQREARAAAQLKHPHIVAVHEVGREDGALYIVSDFIEGESLAQRIANDRPTPRESAHLCATIAEAVHHAHQSGVVHRDLKPANVMLDREGHPYVMDFGLAKREAGEVTMTVEGRLLGTPAYMAPEQARGDAHQADARSDVYSVGVMLFELFTGERPFRGDVRILLEQVLHDDAPSPRKLNDRLDRDLETICLKCLEKDPAARYQTAAELARELRRFLRGEPIQSRPITRFDRGWRWCGRNPTVAGLSASVSALLLMAAVAGPVVGWRESVLRSNEEGARQLAQRREGEAKAAQGVARRQAARAERGERDARRQLYVAQTRLAKQYRDAGRISPSRDMLTRQIPQTGQEDLRSFEWYFLWRETHSDLVRLPHSGEVRTMAYSPSGDVLATGDSAGRLTLWDTATLEKRASFSAHEAELTQAVFSPDGTNLATVSWDHLVKVWTIDGVGEPLAELSGHDSPVQCVAFSPDGRRLVSGDGKGTLMVWDTETWEEEVSIAGAHRGRVLAAVFSPDGETLYTSGSAGRIKARRLPSAEPVDEIMAHRGEVHSLEISPDGRWLASGSGVGVVTLWDARTREPKKTIKGASGWPFPQDFSPDSKLWAVMQRQRIEIWNLETLQRHASLTGHAAAANCLEFSPDGKRIAAGGSVKLWKTPAQDETNVLHGHEGMIFGLDISTDSTMAATAGQSKVIVWELAKPAEMLTLETEIAARTVHFSPDGELLAGAVLSGVQLWSLPDGEPQKLLAVESDEDDSNSVAQTTSQAQFAPDGRTIAAGYYNGDVRIWDAAAGEVLAVMENDLRLKRHQAPEKYAISALAYSPDGTVLAVGDRTGRLAIWSLDHRQRLAVVEAGGYVDGVAFSHDGKSIASVPRVGNIRIWNSASYELERVLENAGAAAFVGFTPDGKRVFSGGGDGLKFWDLLTGEELFGIKSRGAPSGAAVTSDGKLMISCAWDGAVRLWRAANQSDIDRWNANRLEP